MKAYAIIAAFVAVALFSIANVGVSTAAFSAPEACPSGTTAFLADADGGFECMVNDPPAALIAECEELTPGSVPAIIPDGSRQCVLGNSMTMPDGSPLVRPAPATQANISIGIDKPAVGSTSGGTPVCNDPEHPELVEVDGKPLCKGATTLVCDEEAARADLPEGAVNEVWLEDKCVFRFALMN